MSKLELFNEEDEGNHRTALIRAAMRLELKLKVPFMDAHFESLCFKLSTKFTHNFSNLSGIGEQDIISHCFSFTFIIVIGENSKYRSRIDPHTMMICNFV